MNITLVIPYFENAGMLKVQQRFWATYPPDTEIILVDDCSSDSAMHVLKDGGAQPSRLFRMKEKVKWNQDACRNIGALHARNPWLYLMDIDHVLPASTLIMNQQEKLDEFVLFRNERRLADGTPYHQPPNVFLMSGKTFFWAGGYDEDLRGYYGTDGEFHERMASLGLGYGTLPGEIVMYGRHIISDANTTVYERKTPQDEGALTALRKFKKDYRLPPRRGLCEYEEIHL